jgi:hypothetical protein
VVVGVTETVSYEVVARPVNDRFVAALKFPPEGGTGLSTNTYASLEPGEPTHANVSSGDASVWWMWAPGNSGDAVIDLTGTAFEAILGVYRGSAVDQLIEVASSADNPDTGPGPYVRFEAQAGVTYRIAVASMAIDETGTYFLRALLGGQVDTNGPAVTILQPASETLISTNLLHISGVAKDLQPHGMGVAEVYLQVNQGPPVLANGTNVWHSALDLLPGTNVVEAYAVDLAGNEGLKDTIVVRYLNPLNDDFEFPTLLEDLAGVSAALTEGATVQPGEPFHAGNDGGHSIWYQFNAPANGVLSLSTTNSAFDTLLAVYRGDALTNLTEVAANDDVLTNEFSRVDAPVQSNVVYSIAVDGYGGEFGYAELSYAFVTTDRFYRLDYEPSLGGVISPSAGLYLQGSELLLTAAPSRDFEFERWEGTVTSTENPLPLVMNSNHQVNAIFRVKSYTEGFESGGFGPWFRDLGPEVIQWEIQESFVASGQYAARSGMTADRQESSMVMALDLAAGTGSFDCRTSSEANWDVLEFYLNGSLLAQWSGEIPWQGYLFHVDEGPNVIEWRYVKDTNFSKGEDAAFVDNIYLPLPDASIAPQMTLLVFPDEGLEIQAAGLPGREMVIQMTDDLESWVDVHSGTPPDGILRWVDPEPMHPRALRFYRAVLQ